MKLLIGLSSIDIYTPTLRHFKTYVPDNFTTKENVWEYVSKLFGREICAAELYEFDTETLTVTCVNKRSIEPKKKIVINKSTTNVGFKTTSKTISETLTTQTLFEALLQQPTISVSNL